MPHFDPRWELGSFANRAAFTRLELIATLSVLALLGAVLLPILLAKATRSAKVQRCQDNLRQIGQGWTQFAADHKSKWPWEHAVEQGGTRNLTNAGRHFLVLSNRVNASVAVCPADPVLKPARDWDAALGMATSQPPNRSTSYFVGIDAIGRIPTLLAGDHDLGGTTPGVGCRNLNTPVAALMSRDMARAGRLQWTNRLHRRGEGTILVTDGSVQSGTALVLKGPLEAFPEGPYNHHILPPTLP